MQFMPACGCSVEDAERWLSVHGFQRVGDRAIVPAALRRGRLTESIPWPGTNPHTVTGLYDLHDLAMVYDIGGSEMMARIAALVGSGIPAKTEEGR